MRSFMRGALILFLFFLCRAEALSAESSIEFAEVVYADTRFSIVRPTRLDEVQLFWRQRGTERFGTFKGLEASLQERGLNLHFATNAGIFEPDFAPTGLHLEANRILRPLNVENGVGNFYLKPNGVFAITVDGIAKILPSREARGEEHRFRVALQSGPLLLVEGEINPAFDPNSRNRAIRSGIGIDGEGRVVIALSQESVSFYTFARYFREREGAKSALYLDGAISEFYVPAAGLVDSKREFAGMIAVVTER